MPDFQSFSLTINLVIFAVAAAAVWFAGTKIAGYADELAERTGLGEALMGLLLLAGVTSLPEVATSFAAAQAGDAPLAVNNLLGSIVLQVAILAFADAVYGKHALTSVVPDPVVMLQGALNICLLSFVALAVLAGDTALFGASAWTWGLFAGAMYSLKKLTEAKGRQPWIVNEKTERPETKSKKPYADDSMTRLIVKTGAAALIILTAGAIVSQSGGAIAEQSGLGSSFMGVAFVAIATSLPEASTVFAAARRGLYTMAISDILGTNILNVALVFGVDMIAGGDPVLSVVGDFAAVAALLGVATTGFFLMGLAERRDAAILRMGIDSILVVITYMGGLVLLYSMRGTP
ncbi:sodium:calcium antiporter [Hyphococcus sp.]|uniref:sodium:calcium antiporter n=1 Tax=Hyphococcus sp. TaxID=2038636 RepID=UPI0035C742DF